MKYLLLLAVLAVVGLVFFGRRRPPPTPPASKDPARGRPAPEQPPQAMLACAHCGVHLPQAEARMDVAGRPYCSDVHRLLGPR